MAEITQILEVQKTDEAVASTTLLPGAAHQANDIVAIWVTARPEFATGDAPTVTISSVEGGSAGAANGGATAATGQWERFTQGDIATTNHVGEWFWRIAQAGESADTVTITPSHATETTFTIKADLWSFRGATSAVPVSADENTSGGSAVNTRTITGLASTPPCLLMVGCSFRNGSLGISISSDNMIAVGATVGGTGYGMKSAWGGKDSAGAFGDILCTATGNTTAFVQAFGLQLDGASTFPDVFGTPGYTKSQEFDADIENLTDGINLNTLAEWTTRTTGGQLQVDYDHSDHAPGGSIDCQTANAVPRYAVYQTQATSDDHYISLGMFPDQDNSNESGGGIRGQANAADELFEGYVAGMRATGSPTTWQAFIGRRTGGAYFELATATVSRSTAAGHGVFAAIGDVLKLFYEGDEVLSYDISGDATKYSTGRWTALSTNRFVSSATGQPFTHIWRMGAITAAGGPTAPDAITDLAATPGNQQVSLAWSAPADGGDAITDYAVEYREEASETLEDSDDFTTFATNQQFLPRTGWTGSSHGTPAPNGWVAWDPTDIIYNSTGDQWAWFDTGTPNHRARSLVKTSLANNSIGGVMVGIDRINPYKHIGFELVYTGTEDKLILYYKTGTLAGVDETVLWEDTAFGFADETLYDLDLEIADGIVTAKIDGVTKYSAALSQAFQSAMATWEPYGAGIVSYAGAPNFSDVAVYSGGGWGAWTLFGDGVSASTGAVVTGLTNDTLYEFRAAAVNGVGQSDWSNIVSATPVASGVNTIYLGDALVDAIYLGDNPVDAIYLGDTQVYG